MTSNLRGFTPFAVLIALGILIAFGAGGYVAIKESPADVPAEPSTDSETSTTQEIEIRAEAEAATSIPQEANATNTNMSVQVSSQGVPIIREFKATPQTTTLEAPSSKISWNVENAKSCKLIEPDNEETGLPVTASVTISPAKTKTYTLSCTNGSNSAGVEQAASKTLTVTVSWPETETYKAYVNGSLLETKQAVSVDVAKESCAQVTAKSASQEVRCVWGDLVFYEEVNL